MCSLFTVNVLFIIRKQDSDMLLEFLHYWLKNIDKWIPEEPQWKKKYQALWKTITTKCVIPELSNKIK